MFGVTTSDDYRPVAWMGRYPVDVTTMLVGLHVAAAILAAILVAIGAGSILAYLQFDSAAVWMPARCGAFSRTPSCTRRPGYSGSRSRCACCSCSAAKSNALSGGAPYIGLYLILLVTPRGAANGLGSLAAFGARRFARVALWNFCCLRHHLSAG